MNRAGHAITLPRQCDLGIRLSNCWLWHFGSIRSGYSSYTHYVTLIFAADLVMNGQAKFSFLSSMDGGVHKWNYCLRPFKTMSEICVQGQQAFFKNNVKTVIESFCIFWLGFHLPVSNIYFLAGVSLTGTVKYQSSDTFWTLSPF